MLYFSYIHYKTLLMKVQLQFFVTLRHHLQLALWNKVWLGLIGLRQLFNHGQVHVPGKSRLFIPPLLTFNSQLESCKRQVVEAAVPSPSLASWATGQRHLSSHRQLTI
jgi:hypothetical protein